MAGKLSRRRASRVSDAVKVNPAREAELVGSAESDSEATLKERCHRAKVEGRSSEAEARHFQKLHEDRRCRTFTDDDGAFRLQAVLAPEAGAGVLAALEAETDRQFRQARDRGPLRNHRRLPGRRPGGPGHRSRDPRTRQGTERTRLRAVHRCDPKATVSVVVDLEALRRGSVGQGERCEIPGVGPVGVDYARELLGEALVEVLIAKGTDVTTVYSAGRHVPKPLRSALFLRDPRCVVPTCDARLGLENDHWVTDFAQGGLTALDNLARLCRRHHLDRTHRGFELAQDARRLGVDRPRASDDPQATKTETQAEGQGPTSGHRPTAVRPAPDRPALPRPPGVSRGPSAGRARRQGPMRTGWLVCGMTSSSSTHASLDASDSPAGAVARSLDGRALLTHPFYRRWEAGELTVGELREYAVHYRAFEAALPAVLTAVVDRLHAEGETEAAALVEDNLADELGRPEPHLALFDRFAGSLGGTGHGHGARSRGRGAGRHLLRAGRRRAGGGPGRAGRLRDPGIGHRLDQGATACAAGTGWTPAGTEFWDVHADMDADHGEWAVDALDLLGADPIEVGAAARRGAEAWWALLDERQAEAPAGSADPLAQLGPTTETNETISPG